MAAELLTERPNPHVLVLTISDPAARNALSPQVYAGMVELLDSAEKDDATRCVILRGAGDHFCAGGDLQRLKQTRSLGASEGVDRQRQSIERLAALIETMQTFPKPIVAAVEGFAAGAGFSLVLACDLVVAAEDAKFIMSYGRIGLSPDGGGSWFLTQRLGSAAAKQMMWLPEPVSAERARELGLVSTVVTHGQALAGALSLAERLSTTAPNAVASVKELVHQAATSTLSAHLKAESPHFVSNLFHDNGGEGLAAFLEKRPPRFR